MHTRTQSARRCLAAASLFVGTCLAFASATAAPLPFDAQVTGQSDIVGVLDPNGPVVRIETAASGRGSLGLLRYFSADEVNLASGRGAGSNRFVADDGSELFGIFTVQLVPTAEPAVLEPVSYTHLDVYKRQPPNGASTSVASPVVVITGETGVS